MLAFGRAGCQCRPGCVTMARKRVRTLPVCARSVHLCVTDTVTPNVSENYRSRPPVLHVGCGSDLSRSFIPFRRLLCMLAVGVIRVIPSLDSENCFMDEACGTMLQRCQTKHMPYPGSDLTFSCCGSSDGCWRAADAAPGAGAGWRCLRPVHSGSSWAQSWRCWRQSWRCWRQTR